MTLRHIFSYTAPGADVPAFLSIYDDNGKIIVALRAHGGPMTQLEIPSDELRRLTSRLTAEYRKPLNQPLIGS